MKNFTGYNLLITLLVTGISLAHADIPEYVAFCNKTPRILTVYLKNPLNLHYEVPGSYGVDTLSSFTIKSHQCETAHVFYKDSPSCTSFSQVGFDIYAKNDTHAQEHKKLSFSIKSDPGNVKFCNSHQNPWTALNYHADDSDFSVEINPEKVLTYNSRNWSNHQSHTKGTIEMANFSGGNDAIYPTQNPATKSFKRTVLNIFEKDLDKDHQIPLANLIGSTVHDAYHPALDAIAKLSAESQNKIEIISYRDGTKYQPDYGQPHSKYKARTCNMYSPTYSIDQNNTSVKVLYFDKAKGKTPEEVDLGMIGSFSNPNSSVATYTLPRTTKVIENTVATTMKTTSSRKLGIKYDYETKFAFVEGAAKFDLAVKLSNETTDTQQSKDTYEYTMPVMDLKVAPHTKIWVSLSLVKVPYEGKYLMSYALNNATVRADITKNNNCTPSGDIMKNMIINANAVAKYGIAPDMPNAGVNQAGVFSINDIGMINSDIGVKFNIHVHEQQIDQNPKALAKNSGTQPNSSQGKDYIMEVPITSIPEKGKTQATIKLISSNK